MAKRIIGLLFSLLMISISLNIFQYTNTEVICKNIDKRWKADLLYDMGHYKLDGDKDGIPCEDLPLNHK